MILLHTDRPTQLIACERLGDLQRPFGFLRHDGLYGGPRAYRSGRGGAGLSRLCGLNGDPRGGFIQHGALRHRRLRLTCNTHHRAHRGIVIGSKVGRGGMRNSTRRGIAPRGAEQ